MYTDTMLFLVSGICVLIAVFSVVYLIISKKRSKVYRNILQQETELFDALTTTSTLTKTNDSALAIGKSMEQLSGETVITSNSSILTKKPLDDNATELLDDESELVVANFDTSVLNGFYKLKNEINGGGMSRVFLADSVKLGNQWIVKFISNQTGELTNEENILKLLNHISLPKIIDIFHDDKGVYLVESYIEGVSLDKVLASGQKISQSIVLDWAEQLTQVLNYLHKLEPHPIHHYDLKPSNIMVTYDNRLVLIDFGISKRHGEDGTALLGVTYQYAAPEQLKHRIAPKHMDIIQNRFGTLPADRLHWNPDARTDIYSLGVILFELAVGSPPSVQNRDVLHDVASPELRAIIYQCLEMNPADRFQSSGDLLLAIQKSKGSKIKMARTLFMRKLAFVTSVITTLASGGSFTGGYYVYAQENASSLAVKPEIVTISLQQSSELAVEKTMPNGRLSLFDNTQIRWSFSENDVARVDGNRISGLNLGEVVLSGRYRNKLISLDVRVVPPMDGMVDIAQRYQPGRTVGVFAGTTAREHNDGALATAEFVSPESIDIADDGTIYITDSGLLRRIRDDVVDSVNFEPGYLTPRIVRCHGNEVYILTYEWEEDDGTYYSIIRLTDDGAEGLYLADAMYTAVEDFTFTPDGRICFIDRNAGVGATYLRTLNPADTDNLQTLCELLAGTSALTVDEHGAVYLANPETGVIQVWCDGALTFFAGTENEKAFVDGAAPLFYMPQKIKYANGYLFVWDFNVLRRISIVNGVAGECITVAGEASPTFNLEIVQPRQAAEDIILPNSRLMDFAVKDSDVLLTDPKRGVMWWVE